MAAPTNDQDADLIRVTHYINPHNFWFKHESAYVFNEEDQRFQVELNEFCESTYGRGNVSSTIYKPKRVGERVAVFFCQLARWVRAEVDELQEELGGNILCNLWIIDEGVPLKTNCRYVKPLPERFCKPGTNVKRGALVGVVPSECRYDYLEGRSVTKMVQDWSPGMVRVFEGCLDEAVSLRFCNLRRYRTASVDIFFGSMKITSHQNITNDAKDLLRKAGGGLVMIVDHVEFFDKFPLLRTLGMKRFEDNEHREQMKYYTNTFRPEYSTPRKTSHAELRLFKESTIMEQAREKVLDWDKRNSASSVISANFLGLAEEDEDNRSHRQPFGSLLEVDETNSEVAATSQAFTSPHYARQREADQIDPSQDHYHEEQDSERSAYMRASESRRSLFQVYGGTSKASSNADVYQKSVADIVPALRKIKARREAATAADAALNATGSTCSAINLIPAGFDLGNVEFPADANHQPTMAGTDVLPQYLQAAYDQKKFEHRNGATAKKDNFNKNRNNSNSRGNRYKQNSYDDEERMFEKLNLNANKVDDGDDDEQW